MRANEIYKMTMSEVDLLLQDVKQNPRRVEFWDEKTGAFVRFVIDGQPGVVRVQARSRQTFAKIINAVYKIKFGIPSKRYSNKIKKINNEMMPASIVSSLLDTSKWDVLYVKHGDQEWGKVPEILSKRGVSFY